MKNYLEFIKRITMQSHGDTIRKYGHNRRPSYGKAMPISALLMNYSSPQKRMNDSISRDGISPEHERPPMIFTLSEVNTDYQEPNKEHHSNFKSFENIISHERQIEDYSVSADNEFVFVSSEDALCPKNNDIENCSTNNAMAELCNLLCDKSCKKIEKTSTNISSNDCGMNDKSQTSMRVNNDRQQFLSSMIQDNMNFAVELGSSIESANFSPNLESSTDKVNISEALVRTSMLTSASAKCRLAASKIEIEIDAPKENVTDGNFVVDLGSLIESENFAEKKLEDSTDKLRISEALVRTSMMTSPAAKRRLAARKIEMEIDAAAENAETNNEYVPPRQLLMFLVRMGSFNSAPKINNADTQDDFIDIPPGLSSSDLVHHCMRMRGDNLPTLLTRNFLKPFEGDITDGVRVLQLNSVSKICSVPVSSPNHIRILQWNVLSQSLGQNNDGFVRCPDEALTWECRKYLIIQEIVQNDPDIVCLQEVDHFKFLQSVLGTQQYEGIFYPKPDSPCLYISENNGPDGCAIFYKKNKFELVNYDTRILEVWRVQSNQVAIAVNLRVLETGKEFSVCTTHLKARNGALLSKLRNEQGKDLLRFVQNVSDQKPTIVCGDFNAEPCEPVYSTILECKSLGLSSAYADLIAAQTERLSNAVENESRHGSCGSSCRSTAYHEPPFTTWKIREDGEVCHTIDYVFYSTDKFKVNNCLMFPQDHEIGHDRTPSFRYPSDHFSLVCDFEFTDNYVQHNTTETSH